MTISMIAPSGITNFSRNNSAAFIYGIIRHIAYHAKRLVKRTGQRDYFQRSRPSVGYEYPEMYVQMFGKDYKPAAYIEAAYKEALAHRWYFTARHITMYDDYSFDRTAPINLDPFMEIIARHFKQPAEGLGNDNSPTSHM